MQNKLIQDDINPPKNQFIATAYILAALQYQWPHTEKDNQQDPQPLLSEVLKTPTTAFKVAGAENHPIAKISDDIDLKETYPDNASDISTFDNTYFDLVDAFVESLTAADLYNTTLEELEPLREGVMALAKDMIHSPENDPEYPHFLKVDEEHRRQILSALKQESENPTVKPRIIEIGKKYSPIIKDLYSTPPVDPSVGPHL